MRPGLPGAARFSVDEWAAGRWHTSAAYSRCWFVVLYARTMNALTVPFCSASSVRAWRGLIARAVLMSNTRGAAVATAGEW